MKLITETLEQVSCLTEEIEGKKKYFIEGIFMQSNIPNRNGRTYAFDLLNREVQRYNMDYVQQGRAFGELGHPDTPSICLERVSHIIKDLHAEGTNFYGKAKIMDTPYGQIVKNLIDEGAKFGVSSRGMGSVIRSSRGIDEVGQDYHLVTPADIVADPSAPQAFVRGLCENKEWIFVEGRFVEQDIERAQKQIHRASQKDLEAVGIQVFESFLGKL